jgi:hypothetical protein
MSVVAEDLIVILGVAFDRCFDIVSDIRSNDNTWILVGYVRVLFFVSLIRLMRD